MNRRKFFRYGSLATAGAALLSPIDLLGREPEYVNKGGTAKNIIMLISDGMSTGTLNMADLYLSRLHGKSSHWIQLYKENRMSRALMDTASANSIVTDSAAASSAFGGGVRVKNGSLNISPEGKEILPIWQKFKKAGKKAGCVTTVPVTHATPAGFCVWNKSRNAQAEIAETYLEQEFDVLLGGGDQYFHSEKRKDGKNMFEAYQNKGYQVVHSRSEMLNVPSDKPLLGVFDHDALPFTLDWNSSKELQKKIPTLAEMSQKAINCMQSNPEGFVLQIEGGKVDWAAHANDISALIHDQIAFDEAIKVAVDFAERNNDTLVIITTDHGNANPGVIYGKAANEGFDSIGKYTQTNEWLLNRIDADFSTQQIRELVQEVNGFVLTDEESVYIQSFYHGLEKEEGLYNYRKLPFQAFSEMQKKNNSIGWISMDHSADYVEMAMMGPGSERLKPFVKNTDIHALMLDAAGVSHNFNNFG